MKRVITVILGLALASCFGGYKVTLKKKEISFVASVFNYEQEMGSGYKVSGNLKIMNLSSNAISFSNKDLYLVIKNEGESRTYLESIASNTIDFSEVTIDKGGSLEQRVYWVLPPVKSLEAEQVILEWRTQ